MRRTQKHRGVEIIDQTIRVTQPDGAVQVYSLWDIKHLPVGRSDFYTTGAMEDPQWQGMMARWTGAEALPEMTVRGTDKPVRGCSRHGTDPW